MARKPNRRRPRQAEAPAAVQLTGPEISVVQMLWDRGELTLSEAHETMRSGGEQIGYTTVQTRLERLVDKGVVTKSPGRPAKYSAAVSPDEVSRPLIDLLLNRITGPVPLVAHLLEDPSLSPSDLAEMKRLIAEAEHKARGHSSDGPPPSDKEP